MTSKERLIIISPYSGKIDNALSKHSNHLYHGLNDSFDLRVITSESARNEDAISNGHLYLKDWKGEELGRALSFINHEAPKKILFQYVPNMYNPRGGINLEFARFIANIPKEIEVIGFFHELYYPLLPELRSLVLHPTHRYQLNILLKRCKKVVTTTEEFARKIKKITKTTPVTVLPAYSNISRSSSERAQNQQKLRVAFIGGLHPSKRIPEIVEFLQQSKLHQERIRFEIYGVSQNNWPGVNHHNLFFHGHLSDETFSQELAQTDLVIAYFSDGLSTRRGSVMSAIQHGVPVISTIPKVNQLYPFECPGITLFSRDLNKFNDQLNLYLSNFKGAHESLRSKLREYYDNSYSVNKIIEKLKSDVLTSL